MSEPTQAVTIFNTDGFAILQDLDAYITVSEAHTADNDVVDQVLENGSPMTDHIIIKPDYLELNFYVSNIDGPNSPLVGETSRTIWQELKRMRNSRELLTILTQHEIYESMAIESLGATHEAPFRGQLKVTVKFKKVNLTNFNTGSYSKDLFETVDTSAIKSTYLTSETKTRLKINSTYPITASAVSLSDIGIQDVVPYTDQEVLSQTVVKTWVDENYVGLNGVVAGIENSTDVNPLTQGLYNNFITAQNALLKSINFIQLAGNTAFSLQSLINNVYLTFGLAYSYEYVSWFLNLFNEDEPLYLNGILLAPGINLLNGYNFGFPMNNLFVSNLNNGGSSSIDAWGDGIAKSNQDAVLYYFNDVALSAFELAAAELMPTRALNFSMDDLDYTVVA